jgi:hypothetical protein
MPSKVLVEKQGSSGRVGSARVVEHPSRLLRSEAMTDDDSGREKNAVSLLRFGNKTAKRVAWEAWEFTVVGPNRVRVTNASYGVEKDKHSYTVELEERAGTLVPAKCECPADKWREDYDCKHKLALATVGGPVVLDAARQYGMTRGNAHTVSAATAQHRKHDRLEECDCSPEGVGSNLPCWECYRIGA